MLYFISIHSLFFFNRLVKSEFFYNHEFRFTLELEIACP